MGTEFSKSCINVFCSNFWLEEALLIFKCTAEGDSLIECKYVDTLYNKLLLILFCLKRCILIFVIILRCLQTVKNLCKTQKIDYSSILGGGAPPAGQPKLKRVKMIMFEVLLYFY
jgi:hypothetical protein